MKKTALALALAATLQLTVPCVIADYSDVTGHWAQNFIEQLTDEGIVQGDGGSFNPDSYVSVDEFLKMTVTAMGIDVTPQQQNWSEPYIRAALDHRLIYSDEFDSYSRPITRSEIAMISVRAIGADQVTGDQRTALISKISDYYDIYNDEKEYVLAAYNNKLMYGYEDNSFRSSSYTTRAEACVIICRMMDAGGFETNIGGQEPGINAGNLFYVSNDGDDSNSGAEDKPFKTLEKARDTIRDMISSGTYPESGVTVYLRGGDYELSSSFELTYQDSGTADAPVTYMSYPGETANITGGTKLPYSAFESISDDMASKLIDKSAASKVLQIDLGALGITELGELSRRGYIIASGELPQAELYIDGSRQQLARWPNSEWVGTTGIVRSGARSQTGVLEGAVYTIDYTRPTQWKTNINEIYTAGVLGPNYFYGYFPIEKIEPGQITLKEGSVTDYYSKHFIRYENIFEEIDEPGEYYIDRNTGMLYLYPDSDFGENSDIMLSMTGENLIAGSGVKNVTFKNVKIGGNRAGAIRVTETDNFNVVNCEIYGTGTNGIYISGTNSSVNGCLIHDIGSTGISMSGGDYSNRISSGNSITNNHIYKAAQIERSYQSGVLLGYRSVGIKVSHNEIHDMPHAAMIIYGPDHTVEYNDIYDAVKEFHDMDAIYMNVYQYPWERNVVIRRNFIHDLGQQTFTEKQMNVAGIRTDNHGNGLQVVENVFWNIGYENANGIRGVCAQGIDNVVNNNIFIDTAGTYEGEHSFNPDAKWDIQSESVKTVYEQWQMFSKKYSEQNPEVATFFDRHYLAAEKSNSFKGNVVVNIKFPLSSLNQTQSSEGFNASDQLVDSADNYVTTSDPGFVDYAGGDFTLKSDSEVFSRIPNFPEIDFNNIGIEDGAAVGVQ